MMSGTFKVLALDGGGTRGAYAAAFLAALEEETGETASDRFDLIVGTSTGAILGGSLAAGASAKDVLELYRKHAPAIFKRRRFGIFNAKYAHEPLIQALGPVLKGKTFGELETALCITAMNATKGSLRLFKTPHWGACYFDRELRVQDAIIASASAPHYFPGYVVGDDQDPNDVYVDGGMAANNPALLGLLEAITYFHKKPEEIALLSLGTGGPKRLERRRFLSGGLLPWGASIVSRQIEVQGPWAHHATRLTAEKFGVRYYRSSPDGIHQFGLDDLDAIEPLSRLAREQALEHRSELVQTFFTTPRTPFIKEPMPSTSLVRTTESECMWYGFKDSPPSAS